MGIKYVFNPTTGNLDATSVETPAGSDTQVQFNDGGSFGGDSGLVFNKTTNKLTAGGDVELNDGGSFTTTLQVVTPTAARTISFPNATGTVGLVAGSSGQLVYNAAGVYAGVSTMTFDGTNITQSSGRYLLGVASANANGGALQLSGGVTFPATQVAASDPNTLDDYEEGTWTPTITGTSTAGTATYAPSNGAYTKIGNRVMCHAYINWSSGTGTGNLRISGLPFAANDGSVTFGIFNNISLTASYVPTAYAADGNTYIDISQYPVGGGARVSVPYDASGEILINLTYKI